MAAHVHALDADMTINWKRVPKQALVDALRNSPGNCGLANLSRQDKTDLIDAAERVIGAGADYAASFTANLAREVAFQRHRRAATPPLAER